MQCYETCIRKVHCLLDRVVEVKPTYIFLFSEIQSSKGHLNWYIMLAFCKTPNQGEKVGGFKLIIIYNMIYFFIRISGEYGSMNQYFWYFFIWFIIVVHLVTVKSLRYVCRLVGIVQCLFCCLTFLIVRLSCSSTIVRKAIIDESLIFSYV